MKLATPLLAALMLPAAALAQTPPATSDGTMLEVHAQGRTTRVPDLATITAGVVTQASGAGAALADNAARTTRVIAALRAAGIADRDLSTAQVSLQPQYRYTDGQPPVLTGYQATNRVTVRFRDVSRAGTVIDALAKQGADQIDGPTLALADPDSALDEARSDAVKRARARAELYARAAGLHVERIVAISEEGENAGANPPPIVFARMAKAEAATPVLPGETDVTTTLSVRFLLR